MAIGASILGGSPLGGVMAMPQVAPSSLSHSLYDGYRLDLRSPEGVLIAHLTHARSVSLDESINEPATLSFSVPVDTYYSDLIAPPNYVALYDRASQLVQIFEIIDEETSFESEQVKRVTCADGMYLLNDDSIDYQNYTGEDGEPETAVATITAILALQSNTRKVALGGIEASISGLGFRIKADWETPLSALQKLRDVIGGFFWVDKELKLWWRETSNTRETREVRWEKNLLGFNPSIDNDGVITHLRYFGAEEAGVTLSLPGPGYLVSEYWEEGDRKRWHTERDSEILFEETLVKVAETFLAEHARPRMRATVRILDLSHSPKYEFDEWYGVQLGDRIQVYHPSMGSTPAELTVVGRSVNLDRPMDVSLELGEIPPDITRLIADIRARQRRRDRGGSGGEVTDFETDPNVFAPPGTPDTVSVGTSDNTIRSDAVLPILPPVGYSPEPILPGIGAPGTGPYAAPQDHSHPLDPLDLKDDFEDAGFVTTDTLTDDLISVLTDPRDMDLDTALDDVIEDHASDAEPEPIVSTEPVAGNDETYARADHTHLGQPMLVVEDKTALDEVMEEDGTFGYTNAEGEEANYTRINGTWVQLKVFLGTVTTLPAIPSGYSAELVYSGQLWTARPGDTVWTPLQRQTNVSGAPG